MSGRRRPGGGAAGHRRRRDLGGGPQRDQGGAAGTYKHTFGFAPLLAYLDRGRAPGEPLAGILRPGNAAPGAADDLIELVDLALAQLPRSAGDQPVLVRSDSAGASTRLAWHRREREVAFTLGMPIDAHLREAILAQPEAAWTPRSTLTARSGLAPRWSS